MKDHSQWTSLEPLVPIWQTLFCRLGTESWQSSNIEPFSGSGVPFGATSDGDLSQSAAQIFIEVAKSKAETTEFRLQELGAGSGLFAKLFLDELLRNAPDIYARTRFLVTDGSPILVAKNRSNGLFADHADRVVHAQLMAQGPWIEIAVIREFLDGADGFDAVFMNYFLDNLPFDVLAVSHDRTWRLMGSTVVDCDAANISAETCHILSDKAQKEPVAACFEELWPYIRVQTKHQEIDHSAAYAVVRPEGQGAVCFVDCYGAIEQLQAALDCSATGGMVFVNDYGNTRQMSEKATYAIQAFPQSIASGVNFLQLDTFFEGQQGVLNYQAQSQDGAIVSRVIVKGDHPPVRDLLEDAYSTAQRADFDSMVQQRIADDDGDGLVAVYEDWIKSRPFNWLRIEELSLILYHTGQIDAALGYAKRAIAINPIATRSMRIASECYAALGQVDDALEMLNKSVALSPSDAKAHYLRAKILYQKQRTSEAFTAISLGLTYATDINLSADLMELQTDICQTRLDRVEALQSMTEKPFFHTDTPQELRVDLGSMLEV